MKQLNSDLFELPDLKIKETDKVITKTWENIHLATEVRVVELQNSIEKIEFRQQTLETQIIKTQEQIVKMTKSFQQSLLNFESQKNEILSALQNLKMKQTSTAQIESKVQDMIDRHHSVIKKYDLRLAQLEQLIQEKQNEILVLKSALRETKRI